MRWHTSVRLQPNDAEIIAFAENVQKWTKKKKVKIAENLAVTGSVYNIPLQLYCQKYFCKYNKEQQQNLIELTMASEMWHDIQMLLFRRFLF